MISKLPPWVWIGTWILAFVAGTVNVVALLGFQHEAVTHVTGTTSILGASIAKSDFESVFHVLFLILSFVFGASLGGFIVEDSRLQFGRRYGIALFLESLLLALSIPLLNKTNVAGDYLISCASGLQNALVTTYSGAIIRTTHLTGVFTDLGVFIGHALRGIKGDFRRLFLYVTIISGFLVGCVIGAFCFSHFSYNTIIIPAFLVFFASITYGRVRVL